jgi:hypothetical protein
MQHIKPDANSVGFYCGAHVGAGLEKSELYRAERSEHDASGGVETMSSKPNL